MSVLQRMRSLLQCGRIVLVGSILFFVGTLGVNLWGSYGTGTWGPRLQCPWPVADFGTVRAGEVRTCAFLLRNDGHGRLTRLRVHPSCGCIRPETLQQSELDPGESTILTLNVDFKGLKGHVRKSIAVDWEPAGSRPLVLEIGANVE